MASAYESLSVEELVDKLEEASLQGDAETVKAIASAGADVADDENKTALYTAAENGNESAVKALIEAGADVNKATDSEMFPTALFQAVDEGHEAIVKMLIDAGADLDAVNDDGSTALAMATTRDKETERQETEAIAKILYRRGRGPEQGEDRRRRDAAIRRRRVGTRGDREGADRRGRGRQHGVGRRGRRDAALRRVERRPSRRREGSAAAAPTSTSRTAKCKPRR